MNACRCPVCSGRGLVAHGFYDPPAIGWNYIPSNSHGDTCRSCQGTGVVWEPHVPQTPGVTTWIIPNLYPLTRTPL